MGSYLDFSCIYSQDIHGFSCFFVYSFDLSNMPQFRQIPSIQIMQDVVPKRVHRGTALGVGVVASTVNPAQITDSVSLAWRKKQVCVKETVNFWMKLSKDKFGASDLDTFLLVFFHVGCIMLHSFSFLLSVWGCDLILYLLVLLQNDKLKVLNLWGDGWMPCLSSQSSKFPHENPTFWWKLRKRTRTHTDDVGWSLKDERGDTP